MLSTCSESSERVTTAHRAKLAYIYVRQSTAGQVRQHQERTELQYHLVERAITLGWPRERVAVIDDDLGKSGTLSAERQGFQRLISEIGLGKAGWCSALTRHGWRATTEIGTRPFDDLVDQFSGNARQGGIGRRVLFLAWHRFSSFSCYASHTKFRTPSHRQLADAPNISKFAQINPS